MAGVLFTLYAFPYAEVGLSEAWFQAYLRAYAYVTGQLLALWDGDVRVVQNVISGRYALRIVKTCDAMEANLLFIAAVSALPVPWRRKLVAGGAGLLVLIAANIVRIASLYVVGIHAPAAFETVHMEVWPLGMVAIAAGVFLIGARWMMAAPAATTTPAEPATP